MPPVLCCPSCRLLDPYGNITYENPDGTVKSTQASDYGWVYLFQGKRLDPNTMQYDSRARVYNPAMGRFDQEDPTGYSDGMNLYQMEGSNPINRLDPMGTAIIYPISPPSFGGRSTGFSGRGGGGGGGGGWGGGSGFGGGGGASAPGAPGGQGANGKSTPTVPRCNFKSCMSSCMTTLTLFGTGPAAAGIIAGIEKLAPWAVSGTYVLSAGLICTIYCGVEPNSPNPMPMGYPDNGVNPMAYW